MFILPPLSKSSLTIFSWPLWLATCKQEAPFSTSSTYTKIGYSNLHAGRRSWFFFESECKSKKKNHNFFFFLKLDITLFNLSWLNEERFRKCIYTSIKLCSYSEFLKSYLFRIFKKNVLFLQWSSENYFISYKPYLCCCSVFLWLSLGFLWRLPSQ